MKEKSVAAVIVSKERPRKYLLLKYAVHSQSHWDFVKGKIKNRERMKDAVKRELREETGIWEFEYGPMSKIKKNYSYRKDNGRLVDKEVTYFLLIVRRAVKINLSREHSRYKWANFRDAKKMLQFENQKQVLDKLNSK